MRKGKREKREKKNNKKEGEKIKIKKNGWGKETNK